jgi:putative flippase GtrA
MKSVFWIQAFKYGIVGVANTLLTAITIWVMMYILHRSGEEEPVSPFVITISNTAGFIVGVINSFIWNRLWTFQSKKKWKRDFIRFIIAFLICFIPQLLLVNFLNTHINGSDFRFIIGDQPLVVSFAYTCQLIGIVFYTSLNFLCNKYYTFR